MEKNKEKLVKEIKEIFFSEKEKQSKKFNSFIIWKIYIKLEIGKE